MLDMTIETKELVISEELKKKVDIICKLACVNNYTFENGNIVNLRNINIAYVKPHVLKVKGNVILEECEDVFRNGYKDKIRFTNLCDYIKVIKKTRPIDKVIKKDYNIKSRKASSIAFRKRGKL